MQKKKKKLKNQQKVKWNPKNKNIKYNKYYFCV